VLKQKLTLLVVPDDVVIDLVNERLSKPDCRLNGWILDGRPFNIKQIQLLRDLKIEPQKVIALEISDEAVLRELSSMKLHEGSGKLFTPAEAEAVDASIRSQLIPRSMKGVQDQVMDFREFLETAEAEYSRHLVRINAEEAPDVVYMSFCDAIESSL
jgi:adenylate kinase family enzyme